MQTIVELTAFVLGRIEFYVFNRKGLADIATFAIVLAACAVAEYLRRHSIKRYGMKSVRTDLLYSAIYLSGFHSLFIGLPIFYFLSRILSTYAPFLETQALSNLSAPLQFLAALVISDFTFYFWHRCVHATPFLWAFHSVHHSQAELTFATTLRVHFVEEAVRGVFYAVPALIIGMPAHVWLPLDMLMNAILFMEHSDLDWNYGPIGRVVVSPQFHRIHHSAEPRDLHKNFGAFFTFWDRLFGTESRRPDRPLAYGLPDAGLPESFILQFFYPFLWLVRRYTSRTRESAALSIPSVASVQASE